MPSPYDGVVDRYVNRPLSRPLTRWFVAHGVSAHVVTRLSVATGLVGALCLAVAGYWTAVLGAVLFQAAAVLDCCDGDVARATGSESRLGTVLDQAGDFVSYAGLFCAIGWKVAVLEASAMPALYAGAAVGGCGAAMLAAAAAKRRGAGSQPAGRRVIDMLATRDFSVLVLLVAVLDQFTVFLILAAVGVNVFWISTAVWVWSTYRVPGRMRKRA
jgi:phosphatidylglycerophosphate synthase